MYVPQHFREERIAVLRALVAAHPFATLVTLGGDGLVASHIPMLWDSHPAPLGTLRGHVARPNPQQDGAREGVDGLAIFLGPQAYVSPGWYASKREHGKVVPTWNYIAVHASGPVTIVRDADWLRDLVTRLTEVHERSSAVPWKVSDAPEQFTEAMLAGITGVEMPVRRVEGKWKLSQNRPAPDRAGVIEGLLGRGDARSRELAEAMARLDAALRL